VTQSSTRLREQLFRLFGLESRLREGGFRHPEHTGLEIESLEARGAAKLAAKQPGENAAVSTAVRTARGWRSEGA
jgi:hypothetical protein